MQWEEISHFNETDEEHVQALRERCLSGGRVAYRMRLTYGWKELTAPLVAETADAFAVNMLIREKSFAEQENLLAGSAFGHEWIEKMSQWWAEGYRQARREEKEPHSRGGSP